MTASSSSLSPDNPYVQSIISNPLNIFLLIVFLYLLIPIVAPTSVSRLTPTIQSARGLTESYSYLPAEHPKSTEWRKYTPRSLAIYDGTDLESENANAGDTNRGKILLSINKKVFDVSSGAKFYGPGECHPQLRVILIPRC